jgi:hypothetical protein
MLSFGGAELRIKIEGCDFTVEGTELRAKDYFSFGLRVQGFKYRI